MRKVSSEPLLSIHTFCSIQWFCSQTVKALIRMRIRAVWSGPSLSAHAWRRVFCLMQPIWCLLKLSGGWGGGDCWTMKRCVKVWLDCAKAQDNLDLCWSHISRGIACPTIVHVVNLLPAKTQTSLFVRVVWSVFAGHSSGSQIRRTSKTLRRPRGYKTFFHAQLSWAWNLSCYKSQITSNCKFFLA